MIYEYPDKEYTLKEFLAETVRINLAEFYAKKGENDLALGNVVGSNIFNILLILGSSSAICPITVDIDAIYDMIILIVFSVFALICAKSRKELSKREGVLFLMLYAVYFAYIYVLCGF